MFNNTERIAITFNAITFCIIVVLYQQPDCQLQHSKKERKLINRTGGEHEDGYLLSYIAVHHRSDK